jgi:branched-chain amino acid transport system substrate-binding protein
MARKIFVNYRRDDARDMAARVRDRLAATFGNAGVFMDVDNLMAGQRFDRELESALAETDVFLAVIGPRWLELLEERQRSGERDYVREEIARALQRGVIVIPVLIERTRLPRSESLPDDIRQLVLHQKHEVTHEQFGRDVAGLIEAIRFAREAARTGAGRSRSAARWTGAAVLAALVLGGGGMLAYRSMPGPSQQESKEPAEAGKSAERGVQAKRPAPEAESQRSETAKLDVGPGPGRPPAPGLTVRQKKYDEGASDTEIRIGNTNPYSGPASAYGQIGKSINAFFSKVNAEGGINGRKITFVTYDDGYAPPKTVEMVRRLVEEDKVLLIFSTLGTPPNAAIRKYLNAKQVPQLFLATGASTWGQPREFPWTMGWPPDYATEGAIYAKHILANVKDPKIAVLMQNDDYGRDYVRGFKQGLGKDAGRIVQIATYEVADPTVDSQIITLKGSGANTFFNISTPKFAAQAIKKAHEIGWKPAHYLNSVSISVGAVMKPADLDSSQGVVTSAYYKDPTDPQFQKDEDMAAWRAFMDKYYPQGDKGSNFPAYGYMVSSALLEVLRRAGDDLTRENVMKQAASLRNLEAPLLLPGIRINTSPTDFYPVQSLRMARFEGETWRLFGEVLSSETEGQ